MFTMKHVTSGSSHSFEAQTYTIRDAVDSDPKGTIKVINVVCPPESAPVQVRTIELKATQTVFVSNRFGATHEVIKG